jgi:predicted HicB family RNase H-like nuclease
MKNTTTWTIRILEDVMQKIKAEAHKRDRSVNYIINEVLNAKYELASEC